MSAVSHCLSNYATFSGRASRSEFWWFYLFQFLVGFAVGVVIQSEGIAYILMLLLALPSLACSTRRLRDAEFSPWWQLLLFTGFGMIVLWVMWAMPSSNKGYTEYRDV